MASLIDEVILINYFHGINDIFTTFYAMTRRVAELIYPKFQILDAAGAIAAFEIATRYAPRRYQSASRCLKARRFIRACAQHARRTTSVCSGAYLLAAAGLLDGKSATTHWSCTLDFSQHFPNVRLDPDRIFVKSERVWTSAGITAGIDCRLR
jgi:transcriptional regulator GlxA family with amidase domain